MNSLPLTHPHSFNLTPAQDARLKMLPETHRVVAADGCMPLIQGTDGRIMALGPGGQMHRSTPGQRQIIEFRQIDLAFPKDNV